MPQFRVDYDSPWKDVIEHYFVEFMAFFFPQIYADLDWTRPHEFLDKELQKIVRKAKTGRGYVDKLVRVWRKDGTDLWLLIHIEVQSQVDAEFPVRMYIYNYRIYDLHKHMVISLAILADDDALWRPDSFGYSYGGFTLTMTFPAIKLLDYKEKWAELETSTNPFAVVVMAHLRALETKRYPKSRLRWKIEIVRSLYARGWSRASVWELFRFLDWVMELPERYELQFEKAVKEIEETDNMRYVTSIERRAIQRGLEQGIEQGIEQGETKGLRESVLEVLRARFESIPEELPAQLAKVSTIEQLKALLRHATLAGSMEEFEHLMETSA